MSKKMIAMNLPTLYIQIIKVTLVHAQIWTHNVSEERFTWDQPMIGKKTGEPFCFQPYLFMYSRPKIQTNKAFQKHLNTKKNTTKKKQSRIAAKSKLSSQFKWEIVFLRSFDTGNRAVELYQLVRAHSVVCGQAGPLLFVLAWTILLLGWNDRRVAVGWASNLCRFCLYCVLALPFEMYNDFLSV